MARPTNATRSEVSEAPLGWIVVQARRDDGARLGWVTDGYATVESEPESGPSVVFLPLFADEDLAHRFVREGIGEGPPAGLEWVAGEITAGGLLSVLEANERIGAVLMCGFSEPRERNLYVLRGQAIEYLRKSLETEED